MKVFELIKKLQLIDQAADVVILDDDLSPRSPALKEIYLNRASGSFKPRVAIQLYSGAPLEQESVESAVKKAWRGM
jgi:hypothetical protein